MLHRLTKYLSHHLTLFGLLAFAVWGILGFSYDPSFQSAVAIALGGGFVTWGIVHHFLHEGLTAKIVFEYVAVAALGTIVLLALIWRV